MVIIKFTVKGQTLKLETDLRKIKVTSDTLNYFKCQFNFDKSWDGFEKRAYFKNASFNITKASLLDNSNYCYIPWEVIAHTGVILCNITGTKVVDGRTIRLTAGPVKLFLKNIINPLDIFIQKQEGTIEPDYQPDPTPTEFEQFVNMVKGYSDSAQAAERKVSNITVSSITGDPGDPANVTKTEYSDHYNFEFTIPKGDKGDRGEQGIQGIQGIQGDQGEKGDAFTYDDFTPEQLAGLKGEKGDQGIQGIQGEKGDAFTYEDFTPEQLASLKGEKGDKGERGLQGERGEQGIQGIQGERGFQGEQGIQGIKGDKGDTGDDGYSPTASVSKSGSVATITITDKNGMTSASVSDGSGVPSGGTSGQVLTKHSATNYDVEWADASGGGAYIVTFTYDDVNDSWSCDKTAQEIYEAQQAGKAVVGIEYEYYEEDPPDPAVYYYNCYPLSYCSKEDDEYYAEFASLYFQSQWYGGGITKTSFIVDGSNISQEGDSSTVVPTTRKINNKTLQRDIILTASDVGAQPTLVSGTNIKTINNNSILGSGNIDIQSGSSIFVAEYGVTTYADVSNAYNNGATLLCERYIDGVTYLLPLFGRYEEGYSFYFGSGNSGGFISSSVSRTGGWQGSTVSFATKDTATTSNNGLMSSSDKSKLDGIASGAEVNVNADWDAVSGDAQILNKPTIPSKTSDLTNDSGFITGMEILSYGNSTWQNFIDAYNAKKVVYCRASSNSNPASGSQTRLAFMAYVNNAANPTEVEFQYYRSVSSHSASQQGDQVFVYKLTKTSGWTVTTREASTKIVAGTGLSSSYSNGALALSSSVTVPTKVSDLTNDSGFITLADLPIYNGGVS